MKPLKGFGILTFSIPAIVAVSGLASLTHLAHTPVTSDLPPARALASSQQSTFSLDEMDDSRAALPRERVSRYTLGAGMDLGYAGLSVDVPNERDKNGFNFAMKAIGSYELSRRVLLDLGLGWSYMKMSTMEKGTLEGNRLRNGFVELAPRYRLTDRWELGPLLTVGFGADQSLSQGRNDESGPALYTGAQALYLLGKRGWYSNFFRDQELRVGGRIATDLSIDHRRLLTAQLSLQLGLPVGGSRPESELVATPQRSARDFEIRRNGNDVSVLMSTESANFATGSAELSPNARAFLADLARMLQQHPELWGGLQIDGHTDVRGRLAYNMALSRARSGAVAKVMSGEGLDRSKVHTAGYGPNQPLDKRNTPDAWAKNRRVEIRFTQVKDAGRLSVEIQAIKDRQDMLNRVASR